MSVLVLAGDEANGLEATLASLRHQTAPPAKVRVLRDAPADGCPDIGVDAIVPGVPGSGVHAGTDAERRRDAAPPDAAPAPLLVLRAGQSLADDVLAIALQRASHDRRIAFRPLEHERGGPPRTATAPFEFAALRAF
jgi:hypothetical protein